MNSLGSRIRRYFKDHLMTNPAPDQVLPDQVNKFHVYDDVDGADGSHHHTLGTGPTQAAPGSHNHDGRNSRAITNLENQVDWFVWQPGTSTSGPKYVLNTALLNGWVNADSVGAWGPISYRKDATGYIHLRGIIKNGGSMSNAYYGLVIAVLPVGARPRDPKVSYACLIENQFGRPYMARIDVCNNGNIVYVSDTMSNNPAATTDILGLASLANIVFLAEN